MVREAKGATVQTGRAVGSVGGFGKIGLRVEHDDVGHTVFKRIPEGRVCEHLSFVGVDLGSGVGGRGRKCCRHRLAESIHEIGKVLLTQGAEKGGVVDLCAVSLVVARTGHVGFTTGDRGELVVELLQDGLVSILAVE